MSTPSPKSTVRARTGGSTAATQRFLPIAEIHNNAVILKNGGLRAVLAVEALNFNLKSDTEQQAIIAGYGSFVNTLTFPLQIVIRSTKTNIDEYLGTIRAMGAKQENPLLKNQTFAYADFMQRLIEVAEIMQKRFMIVIPMDHGMRKKTLVEQFFDWLHPDDTGTKASIRRRDLVSGIKLLSERVDLVSSGLSNIGLHLKRLSTRELIELYYQIYNPKNSQTQKLPDDSVALNVDEMTL